MQSDHKELYSHRSFTSQAVYILLWNTDTDIQRETKITTVILFWLKFQYAKSICDILGHVASIEYDV